MTPAEVFQQLPQALDASAAQGVDATIQFDLSGEQGGQWHLRIGGGKATVEQGTAAAPNLTISASAEDYLAVLEGSLNPQLAFMNGRLRFAGDLGLAMQMQGLFKRPGA